MDTRKLTQLANRFERKLSLAQHTGDEQPKSQQTLQPGEIENILKAANLRPTPEILAPYLNAAHVPETMSIEIGIKVDPHDTVGFATIPLHAALVALLNRTYATKMSAALKASGKAPAETMFVTFAKF
jgi:hypothetical protein